MSGPSDDGSGQNLPEKFHKTLSRAEFQRRNDALHKRLAKSLIIKEQAYFKARDEWADKIAAIEADEKLIAQWHKDHRRKKRTSKRPNKEIYPWRHRISPTRYNAILQNRREKLQQRLERARLEYDNAALKLQSQIRSIHEGIAWLEKNPAKIKAKKSLLNGHPYERLMFTDGRERIVVKGVYVERPSGSFSEEIISNDEDEIVLSDPYQGRAIRALSGLREVYFYKSDALLGDGVSDGASFRLVGKTADLSYLESSIAYNAAVSKRPLYSVQNAPIFNDEDYFENRKKITNIYLERCVKSGAVMAGIEPNRNSSLDAACALGSLKDRVSTELDRLKLSATTTKPYLERFYMVGDIVSDGELNHTRCNPQSWLNYNQDLKRALLTLDAGRSFIIEAGAGTGKTHMIPQLVNYCLATGKRVKVMSGTDTLDVIEKYCQAFMEPIFGRRFAMGWAREKHYLIFGPVKRIEQAPLEADFINPWSQSFRHDGFVRPFEDMTDVLIIDDATRLVFEPSLFYSPFQLIVLGDPSQITYKDSVFDVSRSSGFSTLMLTMNYRAVNCDLMTWSNIYSYNNDVHTQNAGSRGSEVRYIALGRKHNGVSRIEVRALLNLIKRALKNNYSVGIVAFSPKHVDAINVALKREKINQLAFVGLPEDVQGRTATCVLVSLNVALTPKSRLPPKIDGLEDEQRIQKMNVALSRATAFTFVLSGLLASDIDLRTATDEQALIASVLQTFELLRS